MLNNIYLQIYLGLGLFAGLCQLLSIKEVDNKFGPNWKNPFYWLILIVVTLPIVNLVVVYVIVKDWYFRSRGKEFDKYIYEEVRKQHETEVVLSNGDKAYKFKIVRCSQCNYLEDGTRVGEWLIDGIDVVGCPSCGFKTMGFNNWNRNNQVWKYIQETIDSMSYKQKIKLAITVTKRKLFK